MEKTQVQIIAGALSVGFVGGYAYAIRAMKRRSKLSTREVAALRKDLVRSMAAGIVDANMSVEEYQKMMTEKMEFIQIIKNL
jgi:hypothetical protein